MTDTCCNSKSRHAKWAVASCLLLACSTAGCNRGEVLGRISGTVTFEGQPIEAGVIIFSNDDKGVYITADVGPDGTYEVEMAAGFGLPPGTYRVAITPPLVDHPLGPINTPPPATNPYPNIPPKYHFPENSGLSVTVEEGSNEYSPDMQP